MNQDRAVEVLRLEPDLAAGIAERRRAEALRNCLALRLSFRRGPWDPRSAVAPGGEGFGLLVLEGFLVRRVGRGARFGAELLGPGDLLRPWSTVGATATVPFEPVWSVLAPTEVAVLGPEFVLHAAPWPTISIALIDRAMLRSRHLALTMAAVQQPRVDRRLHSLLWQIGDRFGKFGSDGVTFEVPLTHELLGELIAARRPSVTAALSGLADEGLVEQAGRSWILRGGPPEGIPSFSDA